MFPETIISDFIKDTISLSRVMKPKLLFFIDFWLTQFGLAKSINEKMQCESFAIIDVNEKPKKFFQNQKIVNFNKIWFLRDEIINSKKEVDLNYLIEFEKKYNVNLWKIAYAERFFLGYEEFDYHKFSDKDVLILLEQECKFFESILSEINPDYLLIREPDWHHMQLLVELCKSKKIKVLMLVNTRFAGKTLISEDPNKLDPTINRVTPRKLLSFNECKQFLEQHRQSNFIKLLNLKFNTSKLKKIRASIDFFLSSNQDYTKFYLNYGKSRSKVIKKQLSQGFKIKKREGFIENNLIKNPDFSKPFVYFPLHFEPERSLLIVAPYYTNQIEVIKNIAKSLPINFQLYVKEHPAMKTMKWREPAYYREIMKYPNVKLIHPKVNQDEILKNCSLVIAISGTSALEAPFFEKPSITFTGFWGHEILSSVYTLNNIHDLPQVIVDSLKKKPKLEELNQYLDIFQKNSCDFDNSVILLELWDRFYFGGSWVNVNLKSQDVESFLLNHDSEFELLCQEYLKKMDQYKKLKIEKL